MLKVFSIFYMISAHCAQLSEISKPSFENSVDPHQLLVINHLIRIYTVFVNTKNFNQYFFIIFAAVKKHYNLTLNL